MLGSIAAPAGAPASSENASALAGTSASAAVAVNVNGEPSLAVRLPMLASTGGVFAAATWIAIVSKSSRAGVPLSVTRTVTL